MIQPMLATGGPLPRGKVVWEPKADGCRGQVALDGQSGRLRVMTRSGLHIEQSVPELQALLDAVAPRRMVLDGELVAGDGSPESFYRLFPRLAASRTETVERLRRREPLTLVIFDVLWLDDGPVTDWPYRERRRCLEELRLAGPHWTTVPTYDDGEDLLEACELLNIEGGIAKRVDSPYRSGRSTAWVKRKVTSWQSSHAPRRRPGARRSA